MILRVYLCSQVALFNCLNKFDVELSFLNDLRFSLISNLFLDLDSLFRNLFKLQLSMLSIYMFEFVAYICIFFITFWSCNFMWLINYLSVIASLKKWMKEREYERKTHLFFQKCFLFICSFNITNVMLLIMALQHAGCVGCNSRMLIQ